MSAGAFILFSAFFMKQQNNSQSSPLYDIKWSLKKIHTGGAAEAVNTNAFIQFNAEKKSAGGNGSCNSFGSSFTVNGKQISFKNIFSTKMYCEGVQQTEDAFFKQLEKVNRFETAAKTLLLYNGDEIVLEFQSE
jgi:heat shock protein HslJ